jgi:hypothetical protein
MKQYGIVEFVGDNVVARMRYKNQRIPSLTKCLNKHGYFEKRDFDVEWVDKGFTTLKLICSYTMLVRLKIEIRKQWIDDLNEDINNLNSRL